RCPISTLFPYTTLFRSEPAAFALHITRFLEHVGHLPQLIQRLAGLRSEQLLRERAVDVVGPETSALELRLEAVHLLQPLHQTHRSEEHTSELQSPDHLV